MQAKPFLILTRNGAGPSVACSNSGSCVESGDSCGSLMRIHRQQGLARADTSGPHHWVDPVAASPSLVSYGEGYSTSPADAPWLHGVKAAMTTVLGWASRRRQTTSIHSAAATIYSLSSSIHCAACISAPSHLFALPRLTPPPREGRWRADPLPPVLGSDGGA
uniref:Uncharacterized protein n=1 Tax=Oryza rufipogon TaxID=4529 RepID=A0A0E0PWD7_ORYRU